MLLLHRRDIPLVCAVAYKKLMVHVHTFILLTESDTFIVLVHVNKRNDRADSVDNIKHPIH